MDMYSVGCGFLAGLVTYRMCVGLVGLGRIVLFFKEVEKHSILVLASVAESLAYIQQVKINSMVDSGYPEETIKMTRDVDGHTFELWKASVIANVTSNYPKYISPSYETWEEALELLDMIYHKRRKLDKTGVS
jgi:hypothetical protein